MTHSPQRPVEPGQVRADANPLPSIAELRQVEDHLDWLENHRTAVRRRLALLVSPLLPVIAIAAASWLWKPHG